MERHICEFEAMCSRLAGHIHTCVISFIRLYPNVQRNFPEAREATPRERAAIGKAFADTAGRYGITVKACAQGNDLARWGIDCSGCMTQATLEAAAGKRLIVPRTRPQRECGCLLGTDIGEYNTCGHWCRYCYANSNLRLLRDNMSRHDPASPLLVGYPEKEDVVRTVQQTSWADRQPALFEDI